MHLKSNFTKKQSQTDSAECTDTGPNEGDLVLAIDYLCVLKNELRQKQTHSAECSTPCTQAGPNEGDLVLANSMSFPIHRLK